MRREQGFSRPSGRSAANTASLTAQLSALFSTFLNYPFCVVVDRFVVANWHDTAHAPRRSLRCARECASAAMEGRGIGGLWRGFLEDRATSVASGLVLLAYGEIKSALSRAHVHAPLHGFHPGTPPQMHLKPHLGRVPACALWSNLLLPVRVPVAAFVVLVVAGIFRRILLVDHLRQTARQAMRCRAI